MHFYGGDCMRIKVGQIVDIEKDVNLMDLSPLDRVIASATNAYRNTNLYKRRFAETEEKREEQNRRVRESLIDSILSVIIPELELNKTLKEKDDKCCAILIKVPARFKKFINEVTSSHEFDAYEITVIPPSRSLDKFFDAPYLLYIESRGGV